MAMPSRCFRLPRSLAWQDVRYLVEDYEPDILVSGRPLTMAGEPGPQAERVAAVAPKDCRRARSSAGV
ncbi:MAG: hypothetical protein ACLTYW_01255 [Collinsella sp.]